MRTAKYLRQLEKNAAREQRILADLDAMVKDVERCEKTVSDLQQHLAALNSKYKGPRTTQEDIEYLSGLLDCAKKKLVWEKQIGSLRKRAPALAEEVTALLDGPPTAGLEETRAKILRPLEQVNAALERLQSANPP